MNDNVKIFALALASNLQPEHHFHDAYQRISCMGETDFSSIYLIPCRDGVGADYWNAACILKSTMSVEQIIATLKLLETNSGRIRPSHQISLDLDLIAWGDDLDHMQFNPKKLPLALDVKIPLFEIWKSLDLQVTQHYPIIENNIFSV